MNNGQHAVTHARVIPLRGNAVSSAEPERRRSTRQNGQRPQDRSSSLAARLPEQQGLPAAGPIDAGTVQTEVPVESAQPADGHADRLADLLAFVRRRIAGDYEVDEFGFDVELTERFFLPPLRQLYSKWFRVEVSGAHHLPKTGGGLLVANHSGTMPLDTVMTAIAVHDNTANRYLRMLGADLLFRTPVLGSVARKTGQTLACNPDAERLLRAGHLVGVWPEGFKGIGKPFRDRYKLQRFGRGGFVSAALRTGVPIIPCSIVGAEEIYPKIADIKSLARLFGFPYFPVTPLFPLFGPLGAIPLPSKWYIEFGEPIYADLRGSGAEDDPMVVFNLTDQVRETIQQTLYRLLAARRNVFLG